MGFCFAVSFYFSCNNKVSICNSVNYRYRVVVATAKVQIFKQITTGNGYLICAKWLLLLPQRYKFSSKSQLHFMAETCKLRCCCYRKGTNFQANHNSWPKPANCSLRCCCYRKGTNFQANHNFPSVPFGPCAVVVATAKVQIFKQITTPTIISSSATPLLLLPQRYKFSSKSQPSVVPSCSLSVVVATAKVQIFKQITTATGVCRPRSRCCCYRKGTNFQANHNEAAGYNPYL